MKFVRHPVATLLLVVWTGLSALAADTEEAPFCGNSSYSLPPSDSRSGDFYFAGNNANVAGLHDGDFIAIVHAGVISGEVTGDLFMVGQSLDINGTVGDSVRYVGQGLTITGTVDGDVLFFGGFLNIHPNAHITGSIRAFAGSASLEGTIDGDVRFTGGEALISGTIGGNTELQADSIEIRDSAQLVGDLTYTARKQLDEAALADVVNGEIIYEEQTKVEKEPEPFMTLGGFIFRVLQALAALLIGFVLLALFDRAAAAVAGCISKDGGIGGLVGLITFLVVPAAAAVAMLLVFPIPLALMTLALFTTALYIAKLPVALWLGTLLLRRSGKGSPFLALTLGLVVLYPLFRIPFYLGTLIWWATAWLGLGAMILAARNYRQESSETSPA